MPKGTEGKINMGVAHKKGAGVGPPQKKKTVFSIITILSHML